MTPLVETLYLICNLLLAPVLVALLALLVWLPLALGGFLREWRERRQGAVHWKAFLAETTSATAKSSRPMREVFLRGQRYPSLLGVFARRERALTSAVRGAPAAADIRRGQCLADLEIVAAGRLARLSFGVRIGPMLGLMGTLIPMGPALIGLSSGQLDTLAQNLVVAFSTTVIGLLVGGGCYGMLLARRQWYAHDLAHVEFVTRLLTLEDEADHDSHNNGARPAELVASAPAANAR